MSFHLTLGLAIAAAGLTSGFLPGERVVVEAHNCYPYVGLWAGRMDRALSVGVPVAIELDLTWYDEGYPVIAHGGRLTGKEPRLHGYFFERVRPTVEAAIAKGDKSAWPLYTLNLNNLSGPGGAMAQALWQLLGEYEDWLCTAVKTAAPGGQSPIKLNPILVLTNGRPSVAKVFHDGVPVGGTLRAFGSCGDEDRATNFRRWRNLSWHAVERGGQRNAGDWTREEAARLKALVDETHEQGYWIRFYSLDGHPFGLAHGWGPGYNFGSLDKAKVRWRACIEAGVDFIATDQCEELARVLMLRR